ncbi:hypothetical protein [Bradyrhizobium prioriisuperbiae]|uniref:hypothetical protein n=1 Tax=Bradyrhizobium prioriisuperbiae TaxID=2854389 RepID=UPI0028E3C211|nr:hypothetical protein [Bradyrhizobium prioritasuperba]
MCALCGGLGGDEHWTDAVAREGVYTRNADPVQRRRERALRVRVANRALKPFGLRLADWQGASFLLTTLTGKSEIVGDLGHLWSTAERLSGRLCDPLDPDFLARLDANHA